MSGVIGEEWDFEHYERQKKLIEKMKQYEIVRAKKYGHGTEVDDYEAAKK